MRVSQLEGALLDLWVARVAGMDNEGGWGRAWIGHGNPDRPGKPRCNVAHRNWAGARVFAPSRRWSDGGPTIERERPDLIPCWPDGGWYARSRRRPCDGDQYYGETALIAAMRAYVASKYGDEVPAA